MKILGRCFIFIGAIGCFSSFFVFSPYLHLLFDPDLMAQPTAWWFIAIYVLCGAVQGLIYLSFVLFSGILVRLLRNQPERMRQFLYFSLGVLILGGLALLMLLGLDVMSRAYFALSLVICIFLIKKVPTLSQQLSFRDGPEPIA